MGEELDLCDGCSRHVRVSAPECPFCGAARVASAPRELLVEPLGLSRAAMIALGAALALGACRDTSVNSANIYGAPPIVNPYGAPIPVDTGVMPTALPPPPPPPPAPIVDAGAGPADTGASAHPGIVHPYGAPPRPRPPVPRELVRPMYGAPPEE